MKPVSLLHFLGDSAIAIQHFDRRNWFSDSSVSDKYMKNLSLGFVASSTPLEQVMSRI